MLLGDADGLNYLNKKIHKKGSSTSLSWCCTCNDSNETPEGDL